MLCVFGKDRTGVPYPPHPTQDKVRDWVLRHASNPHLDRVPVLYTQHGVRAGGTRGQLNPVLARLYHEPGLRVLIGRLEYASLRKSVMETFFEIVPARDIVERNEQEHRYVLRGKQGQSTVLFAGIKDIATLGSQEFGMISLHEVHELTYPIYRQLKPRASQRGYNPMIVMEGNPPIAGDWLDQLTDSKSRCYDPDVERLILPTYENWPNLDEGFKQSMERMDSSWRRRFLMGESGFVPTGQPVYPSFVESVHVRATSLIPDRPVLRFWDFGFRRPACVWGQMDDAGRLFVHREWMPFEIAEEAFIASVIFHTKEWYGERVCRDFGDPAARQRDPQGISTLRRLSEQGIRLSWRPTTYADRIPLVNRKLAELVEGKPAITIDPVCRDLIQGLGGGYHYQELREGEVFSMTKDLPYKDGHFEHVCNAFEYGIIGLYLGASPAGQAKRREVARTRSHRLARGHGVVSF